MRSVAPFYTIANDNIPVLCMKCVILWVLYVMCADINVKHIIQTLDG